MSTVGGDSHETSPTTQRRDHFVEIMEMLDKRLNDKGKNWRHVFKVRPSRRTLRTV